MAAILTGIERSYTEFTLGVTIALVEKCGLDVFVAAQKTRDNEELIRARFNEGLAEATVAVELANK